ncbi:hypothetical protein SedNR2807_21470 [Citrobacter sedlakii]
MPTAQTEEVSVNRSPAKRNKRIVSAQKNNSLIMNLNYLSGAERRGGEGAFIFG